MASVTKMPSSSIMATSSEALFAKTINSVFNQLDNVFKSFVAQHVSPDTAIGNSFFIKTSQIINGFCRQRAHIPRLFENYVHLLTNYNTDEAISYLILTAINDLVGLLNDTNDGSIYKGVFSRELMADLLEALIRCRSCYEAKVVLAVYLSVDEISNEDDILESHYLRNNISAALHQNNKSSADFFIDRIISFISETDSSLFANIVFGRLTKDLERDHNIVNDSQSQQQHHNHHHRHHRHHHQHHSNSLSIHENPPLSFDCLYSMKDSKMHYGYFECLALMSCEPHKFQEIHMLALKTFKSFHRSPLFQQVLSFFYASSVLGWIKKYPTEFLKYTNSMDKFQEFFETIYEQTIKPPLKSQPTPIVIVLNYVSLLTFILMSKTASQRCFNHLRIQGGVNYSEPQDQVDEFTVTEMKMVSILIKLAETGNDLSINEKNLLLRSFSIILTVSTSVLPFEPNHYIVRFADEYLSSTYYAIKDICYTKSSSSLHNPLIEHTKVHFLAHAFALQPQTMYPEFCYWIDNHFSVDLYSYFIVVYAIRILAIDIPGGVDLTKKYFLHPEAYMTFVTIGHNIIQIMQRTKSEYSKFLSIFNPLKASLAESPVFCHNIECSVSNASSVSLISSNFPHSSQNTNEPKTSATVLSVSSNAQSNDYAFSFQNHAECINILSDPGYLSRKMYEVTAEFVKFAPHQVSSANMKLIKDTDMLESPEFFKETTNKIAREGYLISDIVVAGLFDCQLSSFKVTKDAFYGLISSKIVIDNFKYHIFCASITFMKFLVGELMNQSLSNSKNPIQFTFVQQYISMVYEKYFLDLDLEKLFGEYDSDKTKLFVELFKFYETFLFVFLCTATIQTYETVKLITKTFIACLELRNDFCEGLREEVSFDFCKAIAYDRDVIVKSKRFFQKKLKGLYVQKIIKSTKALSHALDLAHSRLQSILRSSDTSELELEYLLSFSTFIANMCGLEASAKQCNEDHLETKFVDEMFTLLADADPQKRRIAQNILADEVHSDCAIFIYKVLVVELKELANRSTAGIFINDKTETILSYIHILDHLLKRLPETILFQNSERIIDISDSLTTIISNQYGLFINKQIDELNAADIALSYSTVKISVIKFLNALFRKHSELKIEGTYLLWKNEMLDILTHWLDLCFFKDESNFLRKLIQSYGGQESEFTFTKTDDYVNKVARLFKDIVINLLASISSLTSNLPIIRANIVHIKEVSIFRTVMLGRYYNIYSRILERAVLDTQSSVPFGNNPSQQNAGFTTAENETIASETISILSNLTRSNYDVGTTYMFNLIKNNNIVLKNAFLKILKNMLLGLKQTNEMEQSVQTRSFLQFSQESICNPHYLVSIRETAHTIDVGRVSNALLNIFEATNTTRASLQTLIEYDLKLCMKPLDMLRSTNLTTKLLSLVAKRCCTDYLRNTAGHVMDILNSEQDYFEANLYHGEHQVDKNNADKYFHYLKLLVNAICGSKDKVPAVFKAVCFTLRQSAFAVTNDDSTGSSLIRTLFFLRFVCPAIANPEDLGFVTGNCNSKAKKCYIQLTKALQSASNGNLTLQKFPYFEGRKAEMQKLCDTVTEFIDDISLVDISPELTSQELREVTEHDISVIYTFSVNNAQGFRKAFTNPRFPRDTPLEGQYELFSTIDNMFGGLSYRHLVFYPDVGEFIRKNRDKYGQLFDLVYRSLQTPEFYDTIGAPYMREGLAKDGTQVFVFTYAFFKDLKCDPKIVAARLFQAFCSLTTDKYYIVVDCTMYNNLSFTSRFDDLMTTVSALAPPEFVDKCAGVIYVNIGDKFKKIVSDSLDKWSKSDNLFLNPRFVKYSFLSVFDDEKIINSLNLSDWTYNVLEGGNDLINEVLGIEENNAGQASSINLRITPRFVIYGKNKPHKIKFAGISKAFKTVNVEPLIDWKNVTETHDKELTGTFEVYSTLFEDKLYFASFKRQEIVRNYYLNLSRYSESVYNDTCKLQKAHKPLVLHELLGEVFVSIGIGLLADSESSRQISYELLYLIQGYLTFSNTDKSVWAFPVTAPTADYCAVGNFAIRAARDNRHLSADIISAFCYILANIPLPDPNGYKIATIIDPWIDNLYEHVFLNSDVNGPEIAQNIISVMVKQTADRGTASIMIHPHIWRKLLSNDAFVGIIIEEVVKEVLNKELSEESWDNLVTLITMYPTHKVCNDIIDHLINGTKLSKSIRGQLSRSELYLIKICFLLRACVRLFFDQAFLVKKFLPQLLFICSIYHRAGTQQTKDLVRQLMVNTVNTLALFKTLSEDSNIVLKNVTKLLSSDKGEYIFGLNSNSTNFLEKDSKQTSAEFNSNYYASKPLNAIIADILTIPEFIHSGESRNWGSRLVNLTTRLVCHDDSVFQLHGVRLLGHLSHLGVDDLFVKQYLLNILRCMTDGNMNHAMFATIISMWINLGKIAEGLSNESIYHRIILWLGLLLVRYDNILLFNCGFFIVIGAFTSFSKKGVYKIEDIWNKTLREKSIAISTMTDEMTWNRWEFELQGDAFLCFLSCKVLAARRMMNYLNQAANLACNRINNERRISEGNGGYEFSLDCFAAMVPIYLACNNFEEFQSLIEAAGLKRDLSCFKIGSELSIPKAFIEFMLSGSQTANLTLIILSKLFVMDEIPLKMKVRFLQLVDYLTSKSAFITELLFPIISDDCLKICEMKEAQLYVVQSINNIQIRASIILKQPKYNDAKAKPLHQECLAQYGIKWETIDLKFTCNESLSPENFEDFVKSSNTLILCSALKDADEKASHRF